jgi:hypothetical protein
MSRSNCQSDNEKQKPTEHPNESNLNRSFHIDLTTQATLGHHTPTHLTHGAPTQLARPYLPSTNLPTRPLDLDLCQITCLSIPNSPTHHTRDPSPFPLSCGRAAACASLDDRHTLLDPQCLPWSGGCSRVASSCSNTIPTQHACPHRRHFFIPMRLMRLRCQLLRLLAHDP